MARLARRLGVPVIAIGGSLAPEAEAAFRRAGFAAALPLMTGPMSLEEAMRQAGALLEATTARAMELVRMGIRGS